MSSEGFARPGDSPGEDPRGGAAPEGGVYEWYTRGLELLRSGSAAAALQLLTRAAEAEPSSHSIL